VNPDLVARDEKGQVYTVRYEAAFHAPTATSKRGARGWATEGLEKTKRIPREF
jgi:hypothetical protein